MTDEEVVKALVNCCGREKIEQCKICPYMDKGCHALMELHASDIITRQKAEIERLVKRIEAISNNPAIAVTFNKDQREEVAGYIELQVKKIKTETINEFAEKVKKEAGYFGRAVAVEVIDSLAEEMIEEMAGDPHE